MGDVIFRGAFFSWILSVVAIVYVLWLATRFVSAVEQIADRMGRPAP